MGNTLYRPANVNCLIHFNVRSLSGVTTSSFALLLELNRSLRVLRRLLTNVRTGRIRSRTFMIIRRVLRLVLTGRSIIRGSANRILTGNAVRRRNNCQEVRATARSRSGSIITGLLLRFNRDDVCGQYNTPTLTTATCIRRRITRRLHAILTVGCFQVRLRSPRLLTKRLMDDGHCLIHEDCGLRIIKGNYGHISVTRPCLNVLPCPFRGSVLQVREARVNASMLTNSYQLRPSAITMKSGLHAMTSARGKMFPAGPTRVCLRYALVVGEGKTAQGSGSFCALVSM